MGKLIRINFLKLPSRQVLIGENFKFSANSNYNKSFLN